MQEGPRGARLAQNRSMNALPVPPWASLQQRTLAADLARTASWAGRRIADGEAAGVHQQEETITESVLLDLRLAQPDVQVVTLTRRQESRRGADWVWWWQGRRRWFGAVVQAKKRTPADRYGFGSRPASRKGEPQRPLQMDTLIRTSGAVRLPALYALYRPRSPHGAAGASPCPLLPLWPGADGITVMDALVAKWLSNLHGGGDVPSPEAEKLARPWSCLVTCGRWCPGGGLLPLGDIWPRLGFDELPQDDDLAWRAALTAHLAARAADHRMFFATDPSDPARASHTGHSDRRIAQAVLERPPDYVLEPGLAADDDGTDPERAALGLAPPEGVGRVVLVKPLGENL